MKVAYVTSMFPCWSETFILNELVDHRRAGVDLSVFSLKVFSEKMVHDAALPFIEKTIYPLSIFDPRLWLMHMSLAVRLPVVYFQVLMRLLFLEVKDCSVKRNALGVFLLSPRFIREAMEGQVDHIHAHFATYPALLAWIIERFSGIPFSVTAHAHDIYVNQDLLPLVIERAKTIVAISEFNKTFIVGKMGGGYADKIAVIHCGIDLSSFPFEEHAVPRSSDGTLRILSIGRLSGIKGFPYLIDALKLLTDDGVAFTCDIIGEGPQRKELERKINSLGLDDRIKLLGAKKSDEIPTYLKRADLFVLACSRDEKEGHDGIPVVFMEAMAYGTPVIGTRLSGIPELIRHGETGLCAAAE
ncbi:MAG: glycosyltransferase, partial [Armatimonadota bacterium]